MLKFNLNYFMDANPYIGDNEELREPQRDAYEAVSDHFITDKSNEHAIVELPTGCGKTGLIGILPYGISKGRVLVITPQLVIKDGIVDSLDPVEVSNFWLQRGIFNSFDELPILIEYEGKKTPLEVIENTNFVIVNVQKLQERLKSSLLNRVPKDFFDMIIIDEAHHSPAKTWEDAIEYFDNANVIKLTGTPFRSDKKPIIGKQVYKYELAQAMANNYVKSLEKFKYIPEKLYLTVDGDETKQYTVEQLRQNGIKDEDWINRSVAYSKECSEAIISESIKLLEYKRSLSGLPHKIIAVTCSIKHAEDVEEICYRKGYKTALIHSKMDPLTIKEKFKDIENNRVDVVINVAKLGEGYDHKYLSVAAILRPFKGLMPYAQFIGRVLRFIPLDKATHPDDNIASVVFHRDLGVDKLWDYYKNEIERSNIIRWLTPEDPVIDNSDETDKGNNKRIKNKDIGEAIEDGHGYIETDTFINTKLVEIRKQRQDEERQKLQELRNILPDISDEDLLKFIRKSQAAPLERILRPDKYISRKKKEIDNEIKVIIVPNLLIKYGIKKEEDDLKNCALFQGKYNWITKKVRDNGGMLATFFEFALNNSIGKKSRDYFSSEDYNISIEKLHEIEQYVDKVLDSYYK